MLFLPVQVYESKLQELQKQVETRSLVAETPDEEDLEDEEEEEGGVLLALYTLYSEYLIILKKTCIMCSSIFFCPEPKLFGCAYCIFYLTKILHLTV